MLVKIMCDGRPLRVTWYSFAGALGTCLSITCQVISVCCVSALHWLQRLRSQISANHRLAFLGSTGRWHKHALMAQIWLTSNTCDWRFSQRF